MDHSNCIGFKNRNIINLIIEVDFHAKVIHMITQTIQCTKQENLTKRYRQHAKEQNCCFNEKLEFNNDYWNNNN